MERGGPEDAFAKGFGDFEEQISQKVNVGTHACLVYDNKEEQLAALALLLKQGLLAGDACLCLRDELSEADVSTALRRQGVSVEAERQRGALRFVSPERVYLRDGRFDGTHAVEFLTHLNEEARAAGFKCVRFFGEAAWSRLERASREELLEYESLLDEVLLGGELCVICLLNTSLLPPEDVSGLLRRHPTVIAGEQVHELNPFYVPPEISTPAEGLSWMRDRLSKVRQIETKLARLAERYRQSEERVRTAEDRLSLAVEIAGLGMWTYYPRRDECTLDGRTRALMGITAPAPITLEDFFNSIHPEDLRRVMSAVGHGLHPSSGGFYQAEYRAHPREGRPATWVESRGLTFFDLEGVPTRVVGTVIDISARKASEVERARLLNLERKAREVAQASERRYRFLAESMPQIVFTADPQGQLTYVNKAFADYRGYPTDDERKWEEISSCSSVHPEEREGAIAAWHQSVETQTPYQHEHRILRGDGVYRWFLGRARPMRDADGKVQAWFGTQTDIDDLKHTEGELKEAVRAREEFLSIASHELRTPLTPLRLQLDQLGRVLRRSGLQDERLDARLDQTTRQVQRLKKLVENLLDVSRLQAGKLTLEIEEFDLTELLEDVIRRACEDAHAKLSCVHLHSLGPVPGQWDRLRIEQVVSNLVSNAIKYGRGQPVDVDVDANEGVARVTVRDQGIGISRDDLSRIFGRFERAVSSRHFGGLGLGLFIAKQIVEAHGGTLLARSVLGEGSTFTLVVPLHPLAESTETPAHA